MCNVHCAYTGVMYRIGDEDNRICTHLTVQCTLYCVHNIMYFTGLEKKISRICTQLTVHCTVHIL